MTNPYRAMCAELLMALEDEGYAHWCTPPDENDLCLRAHALLAQQPVSLTCELPEPEGPPAVTISDLLHPGYKLCAELIELCTPVDSIPQLAERLQKLNALADRARALLAQPVAVGPSDEELREMLNENDWNYISPETFEDIARTILARWGHPTPQPVAVSERLDWPRPNALPTPRPPMTDQFPGATKKVLSPAAQAVLDAYANELMRPGPLIDERHPIAAALVAAADQVVPSDAMEPRNYLPMALECQRIREEILAIATELDSQ